MIHIQNLTDRDRINLESSWYKELTKNLRDIEVAENRMLIKSDCITFTGSFIVLKEPFSIFFSSIIYEAILKDGNNNGTMVIRFIDNHTGESNRNIFFRQFTISDEFCVSIDWWIERSK